MFWMKFAYSFLKPKKQEEKEKEAIEENEERVSVASTKRSSFGVLCEGFEQKVLCLDKKIQAALFKRGQRFLKDLGNN